MSTDLHKELERLGLDYTKLYKEGLDGATAQNLTDTAAQEFAESYVLQCVENRKQEYTKVINGALKSGVSIQTIAKLIQLTEEEIRSYIIANN